jgi:hypothetical protein
VSVETRQTVLRLLNDQVHKWRREEKTHLDEVPEAPIRLVYFDLHDNCVEVAGLANQNAPHHDFDLKLVGLVL